MAPELRPGSGEGEATPSPVGPNPDALAALIRAAHAITRVDAAQHLLEAMACGLPLFDAMQALREWDEANPTQRIETTR